MYFFLLPFTWKLLGEFEDVFQFIASFFCNEIIAFYLFIKIVHIPCIFHPIKSVFYSNNKLVLNLIRLG